MIDLKSILAGVFASGVMSAAVSPKRAAKAKKEAIEYALQKMKELDAQK